MGTSLVEYFAGRTWLDLARDVVDVSVVYYLVYRSLLVLRGTRAMQIGIGLILVFALYVVAAQLHFVTLLSILGALIPGAVILIVVVVFQNDIRRALMRVGSQPWLGFARARESQAIDEVVEAATELAKHRIGALITFEQDANLDEFVGQNKGHALDAAVSSELLVSIFIPEGVNKLHDGSVIIRDLRIAKAGVFFPMPDSRVLDPSFGSRHRAALGITEETDAVVVVVSEERGTITFCFNGNIVGNLDGPGLRRALEGVFQPRRRRVKGAPSKRGEPASQRFSVEALRQAPEAAHTRVDIPRPARVDDTTLVSIPESVHEVPPTRIRTAEPEIEKAPASIAPPAPLRKKKTTKPKTVGTTTEDGEQKAEGEARAPSRIAPTPMRAQSGPMRPAPAPGETQPRPATNDPDAPDSSDGETPS